MTTRPASADDSAERPDWLALAARVGQMLLDAATSEPSGTTGAAGAATGAPRFAVTVDPDGTEPGHDPLACRICPLCQAIAWLYRTRPELAEQLAGAAAALVAAARELLGAGAATHQAAWPDLPRPPDPAAPPAAAGYGATEPPRRERIVVTD